MALTDTDDFVPIRLTAPLLLSSGCIASAYPPRGRSACTRSILSPKNGTRSLADALESKSVRVAMPLIPDKAAFQNSLANLPLVTYQRGETVPRQFAVASQRGLPLER
jgi:hypothetical protein